MRTRLYVTYFSLRCLCQWVDLQLKTVHVEEHGVQVLDLLSTLGHQLSLEAQELGQLGGHLVRDSGVDVHRHLLDPLWGPFSNFFNVHATVRARTRGQTDTMFFTYLAWRR